MKMAWMQASFIIAFVSISRSINKFPNLKNHTELGVCTSWGNIVPLGKFLIA